MLNNLIYWKIEMELDKDKILNIVSKIFPEVQTYEHRNQLSIIIPKSHLIEVATELRDNTETKFEQCVDITAIDWLTKPFRYEVVVFLYSLTYKNRVRIKVSIEEKNPECPSLTSVWDSANWYERETFDMYGIKFIGHPFLRRFYMPEDYIDPETGEPIHPLRKDFPLMGIPESLPLPPYTEKYGELK